MTCHYRYAEMVCLYIVCLCQVISTLSPSIPWISFLCTLWWVTEEYISSLQWVNWANDKYLFCVALCVLLQLWMRQRNCSEDECVKTKIMWPMRRKIVDVCTDYWGCSVMCISLSLNTLKTSSTNVISQTWDAYLSEMWEVWCV